MAAVTRKPHVATLLLAGLLLSSLYAAFAKGAVSVTDEWRAQLALATLALIAAAGLLSGGGLRLRTSAPGAAAIALLAAFAVWVGCSLAYTVAPDSSLAELNRAIAYTLTVVVALAAGTTAPRAIERAATGMLLVALAVALYAVAGKVVPGLHVAGVIDLRDSTSTFARLRAPLGYWNALALVCVLGVPSALRVCTDETRGERVRLASLLALWLLLLAIGLTYSRGGLLALGAAAVVLTVLGGARLRGLLVLAVAAVCTAPGLAFVFTHGPLNDNGVPLSARSHDGRLLGAGLVLSAAFVLGFGVLGLRAEGRLRWSPERSRRVWRLLAVLAALGALVVVGGAASSSRGLAGTVSHAWDSFTTAKTAPSTQDPSRLLSSNSSNRWVWWKEAVAGWSAKPLTGWGAGSFPEVHLRYRQQPIPVRQPHSVPLQFLVENGLVGALLALGAIGALLVAAWTRVRALAAGRERDLGVALVAAGVAWFVHGLYDWDWDIPGVTIPALVCLGVATARPGAPREESRLERRARGRAPGRPVTLGLVTLALVAYGLSAALPAWVHDRSTDALAATGDSASRAALAGAQDDAAFAARLDPVTIEPLFAAATIAERRDRLADERAYLLRAVNRQPQSEVAWVRLAGVAFSQGDRPGMLEAARRAAYLDPLNTGSAALLAAAVAFRTPPDASPTAGGTPLGGATG